MVVQRTEVVVGTFEDGKISKRLNRDNYDISKGTWEVCIESLEISFTQKKKYSVVAGVSTNLVRGYQFIEDKTFDPNLKIASKSGDHMVPTILRMATISVYNHSKKTIFSGCNIWTSFSNASVDLEVNLVDPVTYQPVFVANATFYFIFHFRRIE